MIAARDTLTAVLFSGGVGEEGETKQSGGTMYGSGASSTLKNTVFDGDSYGHAAYVSGGAWRNSTA